MNVIQRALQTLPGNWEKGSSVNPETGCGLVHLSMAMDTFSDWANWHVARDLMSHAALEQFPDRVNSHHSCAHQFIGFNDHPDTTQDDVIAVMEKAAVRYDELYG